jgi:CDP-diacylglycerol--serine O-phosphatidyltransferase
MDGFDGTVARLTKTESNFGMQMDSLVDAVTFGLVPAILIYEWGFRPMQYQFGQIVGFIYVSAGVIRLARFNVLQEAKAFPSNVFIGLPIPVGALSVTSVILMMKIPLQSKTQAILFALYVFTVAFLMISNIKYRTLKRIHPKYSLITLFILAVIIAFSIKYPSYSIPILALIYVVSPLFFVISNWIKKSRKKPPSEKSTP